MEAKPERHTAGIRVVTPFRGMFAVRDQLMDELYTWLDARGLTYGPTFFRLHVVAMEADMDIEVGVVLDKPVDGDTRVIRGILPAGDYAFLKYVNHGRRANGTLIDWIRAQNLPMDVVENPAGDRFACRYEAYLTDPRSERMKTKWQIELAIRLQGQQA
ncbi:GyrI-like domain-containing protein [Actinoplanes sp. Pm04-4]|uniref:GyrI-like domain-containing protein n=1 Tax=Paractinoplanes pyxinae TaxID=2997416 RepID=A0ABT4B350_9ACTN|nr:GyrI-like domain-containing protein [Actinoplanes pyxinae]MCY1140916.1 GyrI-like domain-containing protein [Actinoplanes pyxinae]